MTSDVSSSEQVPALSVEARVAPAPDDPIAAQLRGFGPLGLLAILTYEKIAVLDYFDVRKARVINPQSKGSATKRTWVYPLKRNSKRPTAGREKSASYPKKK
jgi:hypothetical protein